MRPALVILAAGSGTRYGGLKQLAPVGPQGEALLEYSVFDAVRSGFGRVVLVVRGSDETVFRKRLRAMERRIEVAYARQTLGSGGVVCGGRRKPWGTGQAVLAADHELDGPFAVINADDLYGRESFVALSNFLAVTGGPRHLATVGFPVAETLTAAGAVSRAVLEVDEKGLLEDIVERLEVWRGEGGIVYRDSAGEERTLDDESLVSMNMWGLEPTLVAELERRFELFLELQGTREDSEFRVPDVIRELVVAGLFRVEVLPSAGEWIGITFPEDENRARSRIARWVEEGRYPPVLWE